MPLRITLKPNERLIINGAAIRNGDRSASFVVETQCKFLRESEIVHESEADTPCKQACLTLQVIHLCEDPAEVVNLFYAQAVAILRAMPGTAPIMAQIQDALAAGQTYVAIKLGKQLMFHERDALAARAAAAAA